MASRTRYNGEHFCALGVCLVRSPAPHAGVSVGFARRMQRLERAVVSRAGRQEPEGVLSGNWHQGECRAKGTQFERSGSVSVQKNES